MNETLLWIPFNKINVRSSVKTVKATYLVRDVSETVCIIACYGSIVTNRFSIIRYKYACNYSTLDNEQCLLFPCCILNHPTGNVVFNFPFDSKEKNILKKGFKNNLRNRH